MYIMRKKGLTMSYKRYVKLTIQNATEAQFFHVVSLAYPNACPASHPTEVEISTEETTAPVFNPAVK